MEHTRRRRDRLEIILDILECIDAYAEGAIGARKGAVEQCSGLNAANFRRYMDDLAKNGVIRITFDSERQKVYLTLTPHGRFVKTLLERLALLLDLSRKRAFLGKMIGPLLERMDVKHTAKIEYELVKHALLDCEFVVAIGKNTLVCLREEQNSITAVCVSSSGVLGATIVAEPGVSFEAGFEERIMKFVRECISGEG